MVGFFQILRCEQYGGAFIVQALYLFPQSESTHRVEAGGGFIEKEHGGLVNERQRKVEATTHSARVRTNTTVGRSGKTHALKKLVGTLFHLVCLNAVQNRLQFEQFIAGHERVNCCILQCNTNAAPNFVGIFHNVVASNKCLTRGWSQKRGEHAHCGAFARTVWPEKAKDLAFFDFEVNAIDGLNRLIFGSEIALKTCSNNGGSHSPTLPPE